MKTPTPFAIASLTLIVAVSSLAGADEGNLERLTVLGHAIDSEFDSSNQPVAAITTSGTSNLYVDFSDGVKAIFCIPSDGDALAFVKSAAFSSMSEDYQIDIQIIAGAPDVGRGHAYYFFGDYTRGIDNDHHVEFSSETWKHITLDGCTLSILSIVSISWPIAC